MKRFQCTRCGNEIHFHNLICLACQAELGYRPDSIAMTALGGGEQRCANADAVQCNWLVEDAGQAFCRACRHNRTVPDPNVEENRDRWIAIEQAKRQLFYSLTRWHLPAPVDEGGPYRPLAFDFLADKPAKDGSMEPVLTGHANGLITLNIAEGDDAERERRRTDMDEPYRTLVGHLRHEIGHYYWDILVRDTGRLDRFRILFGDESADYGEALKRHYANGAPPDWSQRHVSAYAAAHPWEDFAETWAHWFHMTDGLETAWAYGIDGATVRFDPYGPPDAKSVIDAWVPLTIAINAVNRSLGQPDLYPFVLSTAIADKLQFVHDLIASFRGRSA